MADRILRNTSQALRVVFYLDGVATDSSTAVTVTVTRDDGTTLVSNAATTKPTGTTGVYEWILPAQTNLDILQLNWTGTIGGIAQTLTTWAEIVGGHYVTLADLRAQPNLSDADKFTNAELDEARTWFADTFEEYTGRAFVPRYQKDVLTGTGTSSLLLSKPKPRTLLSVTADGTAETTTDWTLESWGEVRRNTGTFGASTRYAVAYEHGADYPPQDVKHAALLACRSKLLTDNTGTRSRELSIRTEYGIVDMTHPSPPTPVGGSGGVFMPGRPFGIPDVDEVANRHQRDVIAIG